jgi:hypothetical protein
MLVRLVISRCHIDSPLTHLHVGFDIMSGSSG